MRLSKLLPLVLLAVGLSPQAGGDTASSGDLVSRAAKQSSRDVQIPLSLVTLIEREYRAFLKASQRPDTEGLKRKLMDVSVELRQKRVAALHEDVRVNTPLGGGIIDLAEFVTPLRGAFQMRIKPHVSNNHASIADLRVFFVSQAKNRSIAGEEYGAGCGKFMEITSYFTQKMAGRGFDLYTADQRYISVLGGTFVMVSFDKEALKVASVSFQDSRFPELMCE